jgi:hypothetical protein
MKSIAILAAAALGLTALVAPDADAKTRAVSPLIGTWALDLSSMPGDTGSKPKSVTYRIRDVGGGAWETVIEIVAPDGSTRRSAIKYKRDGQAVRGTGDEMEADSAAVSTPAPNVMVMGLAKAGRPGSVRVYTVAPGGREMTESAANVGDDGMPFVRTFRFTRVKP